MKKLIAILMILFVMSVTSVFALNIKKTDSIMNKAHVNENHLEKAYEYVNKMSEQNQNRLQNMEQLRLYENNKKDIIAEGEKEALLLNTFKLMHTYQYKITKEGNMVRQNRFFDFLWGDI